MNHKKAPKLAQKVQTLKKESGILRVSQFLHGKQGHRSAHAFLIWRICSTPLYYHLVITHYPLHNPLLPLAIFAVFTSIFRLTVNHTLKTITSLIALFEHALTM